MTKTPEQMAEKYINHVLESQCDCSYRIAFLAGYQAAKDEYKVAIDTYEDVGKQMLEEAVRIMSPKDQVADAGKVMNSPEKPDSWISVKDRLPDFDVWCVWWSFDQRCENGIGRREVGDSLDWWSDYDYWWELPKPPEE